MPTKHRSQTKPIGAGLTAKQMKRKKPINIDLMRNVEALTPNQEALFNSYDSGQHLVAYGCAGTGKTLLHSTKPSEMSWTKKLLTKKYISLGLLLLLGKLAFFLVITKTSPLFIKFLTRIW